jgi:hypothetical protein
MTLFVDSKTAGAMAISEDELNALKSQVKRARSIGRRRPGKSNRSDVILNTTYIR